MYLIHRKCDTKPRSKTWYSWNPTQVLRCISSSQFTPRGHRGLRGVSRDMGLELNDEVNN